MDNGITSKNIFLYSKMEITSSNNQPYEFQQGHRINNLYTWKTDSKIEKIVISTSFFVEKREYMTVPSVQ